MKKRKKCIIQLMVMGSTLSIYSYFPMVSKYYVIGSNWWDGLTKECWTQCSVSHINNDSEQDVFNVSDNLFVTENYYEIRI